MKETMKNGDNGMTIVSIRGLREKKESWFNALNQEFEFWRFSLLPYVMKLH